MAIDTAAKRKSCIGLGLIFLRPGVIPDASDLSASQRLHTDLLYAGIAASSPVSPESTLYLSRRTNLTLSRRLNLQLKKRRP